MSRKAVAVSVCGGLEGSAVIFATDFRDRALLLVDSGLSPIVAPTSCSLPGYTATQSSLVVARIACRYRRRQESERKKHQSHDSGMRLEQIGIALPRRPFRYSLAVHTKRSSDFSLSGTS